MVAAPAQDQRRWKRRSLSELGNRPMISTFPPLRKQYFGHISNVATRGYGYIPRRLDLVASDMPSF